MLPPQIEYKYIDPEMKYHGLHYGTPGSAAFDLRYSSPERHPLVLKPGETKVIGAGIAIYIKDRAYAGLTLPRSGMGTKGIVLANNAGLFDSDYQGEVLMSLLNRSDKVVTINPYERVAQYLIVPVIRPEWVEVASFDTTTERGIGALGSTGIN